MIKCTKRKPLFDVVVDYDDVKTVFFKILWGIVFLTGILVYPWSVFMVSDPSTIQVVLGLLGVIIVGGFGLYIYLLIDWESSSSPVIPEKYHMPYTCRYKIVGCDVYVATLFCWFNTGFSLNSRDGSGNGTIDDWLNKKIRINEEAKETKEEHKEGLA